MGNRGRANGVTIGAPVLWSALLREELPVRRILPVLILLLPAVAAAQPVPAPASEPSIAVLGEGVVNAVPDRAWITVGAESRASSARDAQRRNRELMNPVLDKLRAAGVPADAIRTVGYDVQYEWDYVDNRRVGRGYVARNTVDVRVDNVERVGELLEIAAGSGATNLGGVRFDLKDRASHEREALRLAVADARGKAEVLAIAAGRQLGGVLRIEQQGISNGPPPQPLMRVAMAAEAGPPIAVGQMEIRAGVTLTMSLK